MLTGGGGHHAILRVFPGKRAAEKTKRTLAELAEDLAARIGVIVLLHPMHDVRQIQIASLVVVQIDCAGPAWGRNV